MLDSLLDKLGSIMFDVAVWFLRALLIVLIAKLVLFLAGAQDALWLTLVGLKILFTGD